MARVTLAELLEGEAPRTSTEVAGWLRARRDLGGVTFGLLRDRTGRVQLVDREGHLSQLPLETVISVSGALRAEARAPGGWELVVERVDVLNRVEGVPWVPERSMPQDLEEQLRHRILTLRDEPVMRVFRLQAALGRMFRETLDALGFTEVHTPKIVATGTEGGAELFPLDYFGEPAFLAQSPQFYKEMLVATGLERVYEVAPVYRAEPHATRRHLNEYVSLDLEMGYTEALAELLDLEEHLLEAFRAAADAIGFSAGWLLRPPARMSLAEAHDALARRYGKVLAAGHLDPEAERLLCAYVGGSEAEGAVFVTDWPRAVRPFYAREMPEDPGNTASFDLLAGGMEITTGGLREHRWERQVASLTERGLDPTRFGFYLDPFRWGMPPHGGMAVGLEHLTIMTAGLDNVRQATLFPRDRGRLSP